MRDNKRSGLGGEPSPRAKDLEATVEAPRSISGQHRRVNGDADNYLRNVPQEMRELRRWVAWKLEKRDEKPTKVPYDARSGKKASSTDAETWSTFEQALKAHGKGKYSGIGFVLTLDAGIVCIDLDHCRDPQTNEIEPWAQEIIGGFDTNTEISQSGTGIHIFVKARKPGQKCRRDDVEIYEHGRFIAMTGNLLEGKPTTIEPCQDAMDALYLGTFGKIGTAKIVPTAMIGTDLVLDATASPPSARFVELLEKRKFKQTWMRKRDDLPSASEYEASLASYAVAAGWSRQEIANLLIAWRREHHEDMVKVLRIDYIDRTIESARGLRGGETLSLLPFEVAKVVQYGTEDPDYDIILNDGKAVPVGKVAMLLSAKRMRESLFTVGHFLSKDAVRRWDEIAEALLGLVVIAETTTKSDDTLDWLRQSVFDGRRCGLIDPEHPSRPYSIDEAIAEEPTGVFIDREGRLYFRLEGVKRSAEERLGQGISNNEIAKRLRKLGFPTATRKRVKRRRVWSGEDAVEALEQVRVWISPPGFIQQNDVDMVVQVHDAQDESDSARRADAARFPKQQESAAVVNRGNQVEHIPF